MLKVNSSLTDLEGVDVTDLHNLIMTMPSDIHEKRYHDLLEFAPDAFFQGDQQGNIILTNSKAIDLTGYSREELLTMNMRQLFTDSELNKKPLRYDLLLAGKTVLTEREIISKDGRYIQIEMSSKQNEDGTYQSFIRDVTERRRQRLALEDMEKRYQTAFMTSPDALTITTLDGTFVDANLGFLDMMGFRYEETIGKSTTELDLWEDIQVRDQYIEELRLKGAVKDFEAKFKKSDGTTMDGLMSSTLFHTNNQLYNLAVTKDITERKKMECELVRAKKKAEESDHLKSTFLANLSHEIRTPMNGIVGFAQLLKDDELDSATINEYVDIINHNGQHLLSIINDIIEISKIETNQVTPTIEEVHPATLLSTLQIQLSLHTSSNCKLDIQYDLSDPDSFYSDEIKLKQILYNLISNAIKFTESGSISVWHEKTSKNERIFHVKDTGIGISEEDQQVIFERFRQSPSDRVRAKGGSGLGLSICQAYVEMLGGTISVKSTPGIGSHFYFSIKDFSEHQTKDESTKAPETTQIEAPKETLALIAEDDQINYLFMASLLKKWGISHIRAENGKEAVGIFKNKKGINLVLMDLQMPVMDGTQAMKAIKAINPDIPIIAQTAHALLEEQKTIKESGFDDYIAKPIEIPKLEKLLAPYINRTK